MGQIGIKKSRVLKFLGSKNPWITDHKTSLGPIIPGFLYILLVLSKKAIHFLLVANLLSLCTYLPENSVTKIVLL